MNEIFEGAGALVVAGALGMAAATKAFRSSVFAEQIADFRVIPYSWIRVVAPLVIIAEAATAMSLILPPTRGLGAVAALLLLGLFVVLLLVTWRRGLQVSCGCFGESNPADVVGPGPIVRSTLLFLLAVALVTRGETSALTPAAALAGVLLASILTVSAAGVGLLSDRNRIEPPNPTVRVTP